MFRALLELFITLLAAMVARSIISSIMKGLSKASSNAFQQQSEASPNQQYSSHQQSNQSNVGGPKTGSELHKDPVCGTYVSEATGFRKQASGQTFYYCSQACKDKHSLVAR
jgi:YHS domain-containing protein